MQNIRMRKRKEEKGEGAERRDKKEWKTKRKLWREMDWRILLIFIINYKKEKRGKNKEEWKGERRLWSRDGYYYFWLNKFNDTKRGENGWQVRGDVLWRAKKKIVARWHMCRDTWGIFTVSPFRFSAWFSPRCAGRSRKKRRWNLYSQILFCSGKYSTLYNAILW